MTWGISSRPSAHAHPKCWNGS